MPEPASTIRSDKVVNPANQRREFERSDVDFVAEVQYANRVAKCVVENISPAGAFLRMRVSWPVGSDVEIIDPKTQMSIGANVIRAARDGVGVAFHDAAAGSVLAGWMRGKSKSTGSTPKQPSAPPRDIDKELQEAVDSYIWSDGEALPLSARTADNPFFQALQNLYVDKKSRILWLDCGRGGMLSAFGKDIPAKLFALDADNDSIAAAQALFAQTGIAERTNIRPYVPRNFTLPSKSFDIVIARETRLLCNPEKQEAFKEITLALVPSGKLVILDMFFASQEYADSCTHSDWSSPVRIGYKPAVCGTFLKSLASSGFDIDLNVNATEAYATAIKSAFATSLTKLTRDIQSAFAKYSRKDVLSCFLDRCTYWARRTHLFEDDGLEMRVIVAERQLKRLLSDW